MAQERNSRKVRRGYVVSDKMDKTISVELELRTTHPLYGKVVRSTRTVKAHDEHNDAHVEIGRASCRERVFQRV